VHEDGELPFLVTLIKRIPYHSQQNPAALGSARALIGSPLGLGGMGFGDSYAEEGVPDELEREAVARDEEESDLGVPRRQRRLLHLRLCLRHPPRPRRLLLLRRGLQRTGGAVEQQEEGAAEAEAEQQQEQRRRAPAPAVAEPPRLHPDRPTEEAWPPHLPPPAADCIYLVGISRVEQSRVSSARLGAAQISALPVS